MITKGLRIDDPGDQSVGIFSRSWEIVGEMEFTTDNEFTQFKESLREAFEFLSDSMVIITTFEEIEEKEAEYLKGIEPDYCIFDESKICDDTCEQYNNKQRAEK